MKTILTFVFASVMIVSFRADASCEDLGVYQSTQERPRLACRDYAAELGYPYFQTKKEVQSSCTSITIGGGGGDCRTWNVVRCYGCL